LTGCLSLVRQPFARQRAIHSSTPRLTYCESVVSATAHGRLSASSPAIAAMSSMRLFVVIASPPLSSRSRSPSRSSAPQPPGPGLPRQAPSVNSSTMSRAPLMR
jgi:hypothetical protein